MILLDIMLPRISSPAGLSPTAQTSLQTPVLMLTAWMPWDKLDGFDAGVDDYLLKPFELPGCWSPAKPSAGAAAAGPAPAGRRPGDGPRQPPEPAAAARPWRYPPHRLEDPRVPDAPARAGHPLSSWGAVWGDEPPGKATPSACTRHLRSTVDKGFATPLIHTLHSVGFQLERK